MDIFSGILQEMLTKFLAFLPKAIVAMVVMFIGLYLTGVITQALKLALDRRKTDHEVKLVIVQITRWSVIAITVFVAMQQMGFDLSAFLVSLGVAGFTIGFALQDISKNFVAGLLLLLQQPFEIGDAIEVAGYGGTVQDVDLRATEIRTFDGKLVLVPNADVYTSAITNFSKADSRRLELTVGVAYGTNLELARAAALEAVASVKGILPDPAPQLVFGNFGESSIDFTLYFWISMKDGDILQAKDQAVVAINAAFEAQKIEIPYPIQTVLMKQT